MEHAQVLEVGSLFFWLIFVALCMIGLRFAYKESGLGAIGLAIFSIILMEFFVKGASFYDWALTNWDNFLWTILGYFIGGLIWSGLKLGSDVRRNREKFFEKERYDEALKKFNLEKNKQKKNDSITKELKEPDKEEFYQVRLSEYYKDKLSTWFLLWPFSIVMSAVTKPWLFIINLFSKHYDWVMRQALKN